MQFEEDFIETERLPSGRKKLHFPFLSTIPQKIAADKSLHANIKLYFGCLTALSVNEGYCYACDDQLADLFKVHECQISRWNKLLENKGLIKKVTTNVLRRTKENKKHWQKVRRIFVNNGFSNNVCGKCADAPFFGECADAPSLSINLISKKKEINKEKPPAPKGEFSSSFEIEKSKEKIKKEKVKIHVSLEAKDLVSHVQEKLKKENPLVISFTSKQLLEDEAEAERLLISLSPNYSISNNSLSNALEKAKNVVERCYSNDFWKRKLVSVSVLRRKWATISGLKETELGEMKKKELKHIEYNKKIVEKLMKINKNLVDLGALILTEKDLLLQKPLSSGGFTMSEYIPLSSKIIEADIRYWFRKSKLQWKDTFGSLCF